MGKASAQRRLKRMKYLVKLAKEDPEQFEMAWEKRLSSWMEQVGKDAGRLKTRKGDPVASPFERVDEAMLILSRCGDEIFETHAREALDLLTTECCRQVSVHADPRLFRMNNYRGFPSGGMQKEIPKEGMAGPGFNRENGSSRPTRAVPF